MVISAYDVADHLECLSVGVRAGDSGFLEDLSRGEEAAAMAGQHLEELVRGAALEPVELPHGFFLCKLSSRINKHAGKWPCPKCTGNAVCPPRPWNEQGISSGKGNRRVSVPE